MPTFSPHDIVVEKGLLLIHDCPSVTTSLLCWFLQDEWSVLQTLAAVLHTCDVSFVAEGEGSRVTNPEKVELGM